MTTLESRPETVTEASRPIAEHLPVRLHLEHLKGVSEDAAFQYSRGYARKHATAPDIYYGITPYDNGYIIEVHEGGPGRAYAPSVLDALREHDGGRVEIQTGTQSLIVTIEGNRLVTLTTAPGGPTLNIATNGKVGPSRKKLLVYVPRPFRQAMLATALLFVGSLITLGVSYSFQQSPRSVTVPHVVVSDTPLGWWLNTQASAHPNTEGVTVIKSGGAWSVKGATPPNRQPAPPVSR